MRKELLALEKAEKNLVLENEKLEKKDESLETFYTYFSEKDLGIEMAKTSLLASVNF